MTPTFRKALITALIVAGAFLVGWQIGRVNQSHDGHGHAAAPAAAAAAEVWTCSMHPQVRQPGPGKCPICGMDLIPVPADDAADDSPLPQLRLSERSAALIDVQATPVRRLPAFAEIRLPGTIDYDETRYQRVTAWFAGRVDRLYVDFTGTQVRREEHLLEMYSPQLFAAQEEFLQSLRAAERTGAGPATTGMADAARERLRLFGMSDRQIDAVISDGQPSTHVTFYSPFNGVVVERSVTAGQYVQTGDALLTISDLSQLWVRLEAYESDLLWLRYGQDVSFEVESFPGEVFQGRIAYISPLVDPVSRTTGVRVNVPNPEGRLKPGMFVRGRVQAAAAEDGGVKAAALAGKWICPMHPEIAKDQAGSCDLCGMPLVPVEEMGYFAGGAEGAGDPLVIPATAPLVTGKRAIVYVRLPNRDQPTFEARDVELGPRLGDMYLVRAGLQEGDLVVTHGQFKIDSELQIRGRPSMMSPEGGAAPVHDHGGHAPASPPAQQLPVPAEFDEQIGALTEGYLQVARSLAADDPRQAQRAAQQLHRAVESVDDRMLDSPARQAWHELLPPLQAAAERVAGQSEADGLRTALQPLTHALEAVLRVFPPPGDELYLAYCPMAFGNRGGTWLQADTTIDNPYFGAMMLRCGEIRDTIQGRP